MFVLKMIRKMRIEREKLKIKNEGEIIEILIFFPNRN